MVFSGTWDHSLRRARDIGSPTKSICVIGTGAGGLVALKVLLQTPQVRSGAWKVTAFEQRDSIGGIWLPGEPTGDPPSTALYDSLATNLPHPLMAYPNFSFPPSTPVFPRAKHVQNYLELFAEHHELMPHIRLDTSVKAVRRTPASWQVRAVSTIDPRAEQVEDFDNVIMAVGRHTVPRYPNTPGLSEWLAKGKATHSAWYRRPTPLGDKVLVLGDGPSGLDISAEMALVTKHIIRSIPEPPSGSESVQGNIKICGPIKEYVSDLKTVLFEDGRVETDVTHCILGTGYQLSYPFLDGSVLKAAFPEESASGELPDVTHNSTYHIYPLVERIFPLSKAFPPTSLAFMCLPYRVIPFPLMEAQAHYIVSAIANPEIVNHARETAAIKESNRIRRAKFGDDPLTLAKSWRDLPKDKQFEYRDRLYSFVPQENRNLTEPWELEMNDKRKILRAAWKQLEETGESEEWLKGVGRGDGVSVKEEWVDLLNRLLKRAEMRNGMKAELPLRAKM